MVFLSGLCWLPCVACGSSLNGQQMHSGLRRMWRPCSTQPTPPCLHTQHPRPQDVDSGHHGSGFPLPLWRRHLLEQHLTRQLAAAGGSGTVELPGYASGERGESSGAGAGTERNGRPGPMPLSTLCRHTRAPALRLRASFLTAARPCARVPPRRGGAAVGGAPMEYQQHAARARQRAEVRCACLRRRTRAQALGRAVPWGLAWCLATAAPSHNTTIAALVPPPKPAAGTCLVWTES